MNREILKSLTATVVALAAIGCLTQFIGIDDVYGEGKVVVITEGCIGCQACVAEWPDDLEIGPNDRAIFIENGENVIKVCSGGGGSVASVNSDWLDDLRSTCPQGEDWIITLFISCGD